jgi:site-specific recombinase XerD
VRRARGSLITEEQGLSPQSVRSHCWKTSKFLSWVGERHRLLARVSVEDVDEFLAMKGAARWNRKSVSVAAQALRAFFRYARDARLVRCRLRQGLSI